MTDYKYFENDIVKYLETKPNQQLDLFLSYCGIENCEPSHSFGPSVRDHFLIHYVLDGKGIYTANGQEYSISKNQGFLILPDTVTYYEADTEEPWTYVWIAFNGVRADMYLNYANLNKENLVFEYKEDDSLKDYVLQMLELNTSTNTNELKISGLLYLFLSKLAETSSSSSNPHNGTQSETYIIKSIEFIKNNYTNNIKVTDIANYIGLNRSYLSNLFKKNLNTSPQEFIVNFRINKACELLENMNLSIGDVSRSVGYTDQLTFSKTFKKVKSISPKQYRERVINKNKL